MRKTLVPAIVLTLLVLGVVGLARAEEPTVQVSQEPGASSPAETAAAPSELALDGLCPDAVEMIDEACVGRCLEAKNACYAGCPPYGDPDHDACLAGCANRYWKCYFTCI